MRGYSQHNTDEPILQDTQLQKDIEILRSRTKWIDINQFLEGRRYVKTHRVIHLILFCLVLGLLWLLGVGVVCTAKPLYYILLITYTLIVVKAFKIFIDSSRVIKNIYNIQDGDEKLRFRIAEDTKGKKGICHAGRLRIRQLLPFEYDEIFATYENSYVCKKDGKYGVYNVDLKKMAIPIIYDDIYSITPESIVLIKDEQKHCLTHKGYRIVN